MADVDLDLGSPTTSRKGDMGWESPRSRDVLAEGRNKAVDKAMGKPKGYDQESREVEGAGGYKYKQYADGTIEIIGSPDNKFVGATLTSGRGHDAITKEIGEFPTSGGMEDQPLEDQPLEDQLQPVGDEGVAPGEPMATPKFESSRRVARKLKPDFSSDAVASRAFGESPNEYLSEGAKKAAARKITPVDLEALSPEELASIGEGEVGPKMWAFIQSLKSDATASADTDAD